MKKLIFIVGLSALLTGCASFSSLQTARTLKPDTKEIGAGVGLNYVKPDWKGFEYTGVKDPLYFDVNAFYRFGLNENIDLSIKMSVMGPVTGAIKYQFLDLSGFAAAVGAETGFGAYLTTVGIFAEVPIILPLFLSYDFSDTFSLYESPRFVSTFEGGYTGSRPSDPSYGPKFKKGFSNILGAKIWSKPSFFIEWNYMYLKEPLLLRFPGVWNTLSVGVAF